MNNNQVIDTIIKFSNRYKSSFSKKTLNILGNLVNQEKYAEVDDIFLGSVLNNRISMKEINNFPALVTVLKWNAEKQVYIFNNNLTEELNNMDTDEHIPLDILNRLPYHNFFVAVNISDEIIGFFVEKQSDPSHLTFTFIDKNGNILNKQEICMYDKFGKYFSKESCDENETLFEKLLFPIPTDYNLMSKVLNFLFYICTANADIKKKEKNNISHLSKKHKDLRIRDQATTWNVGFRIGSSLKGPLCTTHSTLNIIKENSYTASHKSKRFHIRRGHYHHYWTGKRYSNERKLILRWVEPTAIGLASVKNPTVLHKVS